MTFAFERDPGSGLIVVNIQIDDKFELNMVLDTGATNTTINSNALYLLGFRKDNFQIQVYDFLAHGIFSDYNGLLGLDFLEGTKFCIDTKSDTITVN